MCSPLQWKGQSWAKCRGLEQSKVDEVDNDEVLVHFESVPNFLKISYSLLRIVQVLTGCITVPLPTMELELLNNVRSR